VSTGNLPILAGGGGGVGAISKDRKILLSSSYEIRYDYPLICCSFAVKQSKSQRKTANKQKNIKGTVALD
jgi:hypothetical protein